MSDIIIGIDFSINSTAITINNNNIYNFALFIPNLNLKSKTFIQHKNLSDLGICDLISYEKLSNIKNEYSKTESIKLNNALNLSNAIYEYIKQIENIKSINIEGFSYGSKGKSFIDLILYNSFLRKILFMNYKDSINIIAPSENKKNFTGKGNANKVLMYDNFILNHKDNKLYEYIKSNEILINNKIIKPFDDLIDSYALSLL